MDPLIEGYRRFRAETWPAERERYEALAHWGQSPETMVIACSDSRVDPQTVFGAVPGELFVVRNVAALVPPYGPATGYHGTSAALEFGVKVLKSRASSCSGTDSAAASGRWLMALRRKRAISSPPGWRSAGRR